MLGSLIAWVSVVLPVSYVMGIFVYDHFRKKRGAPSLFLDQCESEGRGKRLIRQYRRKYGIKSK